MDGQILSMLVNKTATGTVDNLKMVKSPQGHGNQKQINSMRIHKVNRKQHVLAEKQVVYTVKCKQTCFLILLFHLRMPKFLISGLIPSPVDMCIGCHTS